MGSSNEVPQSSSSSSSSSSRRYKPPTVVEMLKVNDDPMLEYRQAAVYLNIKESYLRDLAKQKRIETVKVVGVMRIRLSECDRILREGTRPATRPLSPTRFD